MRIVTLLSMSWLFTRRWRTFLKSSFFILAICCFSLETLSNPKENLSDESVRNDEGDLLHVGQLRYKRSASDVRDPRHPCNTFIFLNETERSNKNLLDVDYDQQILCDRTLRRHWYRFGTGSGRLPETCPSELSCGTHSPIYLDAAGVGGHPNEIGKEVFTRVCAVLAGNCCIRGWYIGIINCGSFYVYRLTSTPGCYMAYCVEG